ncbi:MAG: hypothetical protein VX733_14760 [Candidatus Latescibacterota bacterium]|nr:hypothetical protein [Candidatus Latescibacterota bacterium]
MQEATAAYLAEAGELLAEILREARQGQSDIKKRRAAIRALLLGADLAREGCIGDAVDRLLETVISEDWEKLFGDAVERELPGLLVELVQDALDVSHVDTLRLVPEKSVKPLIDSLKRLDRFLNGLEGSRRRLAGMRVCLIMSDIYERLQDPKIWRRRNLPACAVDSRHIVVLKEAKDFASLPQAYRARINQLQRVDLRHSLRDVAETRCLPMEEADWDTVFTVRSPLRLGISSANASDNHARSKEQGGKTVNAAIDLQVEGSDQPVTPVTVTLNRLPEARLVLKARSTDFHADFEANDKGDRAAQSELFFSYRRGGDKSLRMAKQALVHSGIIRPDSHDVVQDVVDFTGGGGLEIKTASAVLQGSGLGTSSILAAALLKALYRAVGDPAGTSEGEYPSLYDQSVLLEQSIGLNSGWQDARGARGGDSAVKDFYAPPTEGLPAPELRHIEVDENTFVERIVLFDTGIARGATRGLNAVLDAYLSRDRLRYPAVSESLQLHDEIVATLSAQDYPALGKLATRYWALRCILDPEATTSDIQQLFAGEVAELIEGGMLTGAGGGGFALLVSKEGEEQTLRRCLHQLRGHKAFARSRVVDYRLNRLGLQLDDE